MDMLMGTVVNPEWVTVTCVPEEVGVSSMSTCVSGISLSPQS